MGAKRSFPDAFVSAGVMNTRVLLTVGALCASVAIVCVVLQGSDQIVEEQVLETRDQNDLAAAKEMLAPFHESVRTASEALVSDPAEIAHESVDPSYEVADMVGHDDEEDNSEHVETAELIQQTADEQAVSEVSKETGAQIDETAEIKTKHQLTKLKAAMAARNDKLKAAQAETARLKRVAQDERTKIDALVGQLKENANLMLAIGNSTSHGDAEECLTPPTLPAISMVKHEKLQSFNFHYKKLCSGEIKSKSDKKEQAGKSKEKSAKAVEGLQKLHLKAIEQTNKKEVKAKESLEKKRTVELKSKGESEGKVKGSKEKLEKAKELYSKQKTLHVEKEQKEHTSKHEQKEKKCAESRIKESAAKRTDEAGIKETSDKAVVKKEVAKKGAIEKEKKGGTEKSSKEADNKEEATKVKKEKAHKEKFAKGKVKEASGKSEALSKEIAKKKTTYKKWKENYSKGEDEKGTKKYTEFKSKCDEKQTKIHQEKMTKAVNEKKTRSASIEKALKPELKQKKILKEEEANKKTQE